MSPHHALHDPVFQAYLRIILVSLAAGGIVLCFLQWGLKKQLGLIWSTYRSWLVLAPIGLAVIFAGRVPTIIGVTLLAIFGFKEFARVSGLYRDWWMVGAVYAGILTVGAASLMPHPRGEEPGAGWYGFFVAVPVFAIALILIVPILRNRARGELQRMSLGIVGFVYIGWMFGHLGFLANAVNAYGYLLYVIFATELNDVAAFTFGRLFGRHPLRSEISPKKTWEGALGALGVSMVLPWLLHFSFPEFGPWQLILTGLIVGIGGQLGDLSISVIKRDIGTKDMGGLIPGHGGILDRIDSLIYVAPLFLHMAGYYHAARRNGNTNRGRPRSNSANGCGISREPDMLSTGCGLSWRWLPGAPPHVLPLRNRGRRTFAQQSLLCPRRKPFQPSRYGMPSGWVAAAPVASGVPGRGGGLFFQERAAHVDRNGSGERLALRAAD